MASPPHAFTWAARTNELYSMMSPFFTSLTHRDQLAAGGQDRHRGRRATFSLA
jgi:hypothetical protein